MTLLTEHTDSYDEPGSWGRLSEEWPVIRGDIALELYRHANTSMCIPYGSYVLVSEKGQYGADESALRVHPDYIEQLRKLEQWL